MTERPRLPVGCADRLRDWVLDRHPAALEDPEFLTDLMAIVAEELARAVREACWRHRRKAGGPCEQ